MWDDRVKPQRRGYIKRSTKPIKRSYIKPKPKRDRTFKDGRVRLASKSSLRRRTCDAAGEICQHEIDGKICGKPAPWAGPWYRRGHLAHKKHGAGKRDDRFGESYWACGDCHRAHHGGGKPCPRKVKMPVIYEENPEVFIRMIGDDDLMAIERDNQTRITTMKELLGEE